MTLSGVLPVIPTPFLDGEIDYDSFRRLLTFFLPHVDGYTLGGSTSEAPSLSVTERQSLLEFAMRHTPADKKVVVGLAHTDANTAIELARHAEAQGAHGFLIPSPYYFPNTKRGVYEYLKRIDAHVQTDVIFYDNPYTTNTNFF